MDPGSATVLVAFGTGAALALWGATVAVGAYAIYFWVYKPWKVVRADLKALDDKCNAALAAVQQARVMALTDEEVAMREKRMQARQGARREQGVGA